MQILSIWLNDKIEKGKIVKAEWFDNNTKLRVWVAEETTGIVRAVLWVPDEHLIVEPKVQPPELTVQEYILDLPAENLHLFGSEFWVSHNFTDVHISTDWQIWDENETMIIWESLNDTENLTEIIISDLLLNSTTLVFKVRYRGQMFGEGEWGSLVGTIEPTQWGIFTWGDNSVSQLGINNTEERLRPVQVTENTDYSLGWLSQAQFNAVVKSNGTLWTWGRNNYGQLGLGDNITRRVITQVGTDTDWKQVVCGSEFTVAIKTDGTLWSWGRGTYGALGHGDTANINTPTQIGSDTDWDKILSGTWHTLALKTDGSLWAWGFNNHGQLGVGDTTTRLEPVLVTTDT
jgi:hypothetical protein